MSEMKICPVCVNEIPENAKYVCPNCWSDLQKFSDVEYVANQIRIFQQESVAQAKRKKKRGRWSWGKYYLVGILTCLSVGIIAEHIISSINELLMEEPQSFNFQDFIFITGIFLPFGLLAGFISSQLEEKFRNPMLRGWFIYLTIMQVLSFVFLASIFLLFT